MTAVRLLKNIGLFIALVVVVVACGTPAEVPPTDATILSFTATGLDKGEGQWQLAWSTEAAEVTLNGETVSQSGSREVAATETEYTLVARSGAKSQTESITVGPITGVSITDNSGRSSPFMLEPGDTLQLQASVEASAASVPPLQAVTWRVEPEGILEVDQSGLVTAVGLGEAQVFATSQQWTGRYTFARVNSVIIPRIHSFSATPMANGAGEWELNWNAEADTVTLNGVAVTESGSLTVSPDTATDYQLLAVNGDLEAEDSITLAPVSGFSVTGLPEPPEPALVGQAETIRFSVSVEASGSDVPPAQGVAFASSDSSVLQVSAAGEITGVSPGTASVAITSAQDSTVSQSFAVEVLGPGLYALSVPDAAGGLEAGSEVDLTWHAVALNSLTVTELAGGVAGTPQQILPPDMGELTVTVPSDEASVNYRFNWTDVNGVSGSRLVWPADSRVLGWVCSRNDQVVTFDDPRLDTLVRDLFDLDPGETIRCEDVQETFPANPNADGQEQTNAILNNLCQSTEGEPVLSLEGIQHLVNLVRLELECNNITDISRLASMTGLVEINFDNNEITDVTPLHNLSNVEVLGVYNNNISSIEGLAGMTSLQILYLSENAVKDVSPLSDLEHLEHVWLYMNCTNIERDPDGTPTDWSDCLTDLSPLENLTNMVSLVFHHNEVEDISFINDTMSRLELIVARDNRITDASSLADLPALTTVVIDQNYLTSLQPFLDNTDFPDGGIYSWSRGTVSMPPRNPFEGHLLVGYNCMNLREEPFAGQMETLRDRGMTVVGDAAELPLRDCAAGGAGSLSARSLPPQFLNLIRMK